MLRSLIALLVLAAVPAAAQFIDINGQTSGNLPGTRLRHNYTIAELPDATLNTSVAAIITNGSSAAGDCTTTGSDLVWCYSNGTSWVPISGGGGGAVTTVFGRSGTVTAVAGDYTASEITNVAAGSIVAVTAQAAIDELDTEKLALSGGTMTGALNVDEANFNLRDAEDDIQLQLIAGALNLFDTSGSNQTFRIDGGGLSFGSGHTLDFSQTVTWNGTVGASLQLATDKINMSTGAGFQVAGNDVLTTLTGQALDADLTALAALASTGILARTASDTYAQRTLTGDAEIVVADGDGVAGNPTLSIAATLTRDTEIADMVEAAATSGADNTVLRSIGDSRDMEGTGVTIDDNDKLTAPGGLEGGDGTASAGIILNELTASSGSESFRIYGADDQSADGCIVLDGPVGDDQVLKGTATTTTDSDGKTCRVMAAEADSGGGSGDPVGANVGQSFTSQTSVALTHSFGHNKLIVSCYDGSEQEIGYDTLTIGSDPFTATVTFTSAQTGRCVVSGGGAAVYQATITAQTSFAVTAATHGLGTNAYVAACHDNSATPEQIGFDSAPRNGSGDITLNFGTAFTGTCEIRQ